VNDDVDCDVIDARQHRPSVALDASLATVAMATDAALDDDDADDNNEDPDVDGKRRKKTRTVFSRHQVNFIHFLQPPYI